jgi:hypothetical protein
MIAGWGWRMQLQEIGIQVERRTSSTEGIKSVSELRHLRHDTCPGDTEASFTRQKLRTLSPLMSLFPPSSAILIRLWWFEVPASRNKRWYGTISVSKKTNTLGTF